MINVCVNCDSEQNPKYQSTYLPLFYGKCRILYYKLTIFASGKIEAMEVSAEVKIV